MKPKAEQLIQLLPARLFLTIVMLLVVLTVEAAPVTSLTSGNWSASAWPNTLRSGTITTSNLSLNITGVGTSFTTELSVGNIIKTIAGVNIGTVAVITDNTHLILTSIALSNNSNITYRSQGVGPIDAVTIPSGAVIIVDGNFTCASLSFSIASINSSVTITGTNSLNVAGAVTLARPAISAITSTLAVGAGSLIAGSLNMSATLSGRNDILSISTGTVTVNGAFATGSNGCLVTFTGAGTLRLAGAYSGTPSITQFAGNTWNYSGAAQSLAGTAYNNLILSGSGVKTLSGVTVNGILSMEGTATVSAAPVYGAAATLRYNTSVARTAGSEWTSSFSSTGGIVIANTGTISLNSSETVNTTLTINTGSFLNTNTSSSFTLTIANDFLNNGTLTANASVINIKKNWINNGTFVRGTGTVAFNGTAAQNIDGTGSNTFNNLTISNSLGISLLNNTTVNGTLTFTSGKISTGAFSFYLGNAATVSGAGAGMYIFGNLFAGIPAAATTKTFYIGDASVYTPVTLTFTGTTNSTGNIGLITTAGNSPNINTSNINPLLSVNRYWTITNNGVTGITSYAAVFNFNAADVDGGAAYASFIAGQYSASSWTYPIVGTTTSTSVQVTGLTAYGQFQTGESLVISAAQYGANGSTAMTDVLPYINMSADPQTIAANYAAHQYFTMNVIKGITYDVYTCNAVSPANPLMLTVYKEGAPTDANIAFSTVNTGNTCTVVANNAFVSFTPAFSGQVRVLINRKGNVNSTTPAALTVKVNVSGGNNTLDDQMYAITDSWVGHIFDGVNFNNYLGYYLTGAESFNAAFGTTGTWPNNTSDDVTSFNFLSWGTVRASVKDVSFSVRYRMNSSKRGLYTSTITSDDGSRLFVDGTSVYSEWLTHTTETRNNILLSLSGNSSLIFEYYESTGQNVAGVYNLVQIFPNTLSLNINQTIHLNTTGSAISGDIYGSLPTGITVVGTGYQWAYSTSQTGPWTDISGATSATFTPLVSGPPFNTPGIYYVIRKAVVRSVNNVLPNPYTATNVSNYATVTIKIPAGTWLGATSDDWNTPANWAEGIPSGTTDVFIAPGSPFQPTVLSSAANARDITISAGAVLTIAAGQQLNVAGTLSNNAGSAGLILQSNLSGTASLLHGTNNVPATVNCFISGDTEAWHFLSSPVTGQSLSGAWLPSGSYSNGTGYDLYVWDEATSCWIYRLNSTSIKNWNTVHPESNFVTGRGYLYSVLAANPTKQFSGVLNNGNINLPVSLAGTNINLTGFTFLGNPYPSSVDWQASSGWTRTDLVSSGSGYDMWIWNPAASNFGVMNSATGTGTNGVTRYIAPMQGFFVRAKNNGTVVIKNSSRVNNGNGSWLKKALDVSDKKALSVKVSSDAGSGYDEVQFFFGSEANESGAAKLFSQVTTAPSLFYLYKEESYSSSYFTDTIENQVIPVMFKSGKDGYYSLELGEYDQFENLILEDRKLNVFQDIKEKNIYRFTSKVTDSKERFLLHFVPVIKPEDKEIIVSVYASQKKLIIDLSRLTTETDVVVSDMMGRVLIKTKLQGETRHYMDLDAKPQLLLVYLKNKMSTVCRKVMWLND